MDATLTIVPRNPNKRPKVWAIHALHMQSVAFDTPMPFQATLTNAIPPGEIRRVDRSGPGTPTIQARPRSRENSPSTRRTSVYSRESPES